MKDTGIRIGRVSSIDYDTGMMQILYKDKGNATTAKMPYANFNNEYCMPKIGEQVLVTHLSNGTSRGVVLGTMWNKKNIPAENGKNLYRKELSKVKGAAYERYDDETGEYLLRVPIMMIHGIDRTDVEGPEVNIAANHRTSFESPEHTASIKNVTVEGLEEEEIDCTIKNNVNITMDIAELEALILAIKLETMEAMQIRAGTDMKIYALENMGMDAGRDARMTAKENANVTAGNNLMLEDGAFATTLSAIMERLEAIDHNTSARK